MLLGQGAGLFAHEGGGGTAQAGGQLHHAAAQLHGAVQCGLSGSQQDFFHLFHKLAPYFTELDQSMTDRRFSGQTALAPLVAMS